MSDKKQESCWHEYGLDRAAQHLVLNHRSVIKESHKMREAVAYGLERFWGEHLRYKDKKKKEDQQKSAYWKATWDELVKILGNAGITLPNDKVDLNNEKAIKNMAKKLWGELPLDYEIEEKKGDRTKGKKGSKHDKSTKGGDKQGETLSLDDRRVALAVLTQLCDCLVWWTQRYKGEKE